VFWFAVIIGLGLIAYRKMIRAFLVTFLLWFKIWLQFRPKTFRELKVLETQIYKTSMYMSLRERGLSAEEAAIEVKRLYPYETGVTEL
jgi:hypothetical protein